MSDPSGAVFLSYASQDTEAAKRICEALRAAGVEVWFDQNELVGGDAWDSKIRKQIASCALFVPVISAATQARLEGYFRLEWKLAAQRTHTMADEKTFLMPVVIDDTRDAAAKVPAEFKAVQWTKLPGGEAPERFCARVKHVLAGARSGAEPVPAEGSSAGQRSSTESRGRARRRLPLAIGIPVALVAIIAAVIVVWPRRGADRSAAPKAVASLTEAQSLVAQARKLLAKAPAPAAKSVSASDKSVAVLPFANLSTEQDNAFFAEGVHDDVITNLQKIRDLKVISRTSVMAFRDASARQLGRIATELGVAHIVEGSVRRVGNQVRVNAKLITARTEESLWADSFDGDAGDVFALQATIAQRIAAALKATLTSGEKILIERRPTVNLSAHEDYLRAKTQEETLTTTAARERFEQVIALHDQAVAKDPGFALAWMRLTILHSRMVFIAQDASPERRTQAETALRAAERLAPDAPETHLARGAFAFYVDRDWRRAQREINAAQAGLPNEEQLAFMAAATHVRLGEWTEAIRDFERAVTLSPRDSYIGTFAALFHLLCRRYERALELIERHATWLPSDRVAQEYRMRARFTLDGDRAAFLRSYAALPRRRNNPEQSYSTVGLTLQAGDYMMLAEQLAEMRRTNPDHVAGGVLEGPVALRQAMTGWLLGQRESARQFAEEAISVLEARQPTARHQPTELMWIALAKAYAGRGDAAVADARRAVAQMTQLDALQGVVFKNHLGRVFLIVGRAEEALDVLRELMRLPADQTLNELRWDPFWSRLKTDPRFEETLRTAKTL